MSSKMKVLAVLGTFAAIGCDTPAQQEEHARQEQTEREELDAKIESERKAAIEQAKRELAEEMRQERENALESWEDAFRGELEQSTTLARKLDRRLLVLELELTSLEMQHVPDQEKDARKTFVQDYRKRLEVVRLDTDKLFQMTGEERDELASRIDADLAKLEKEIRDERGKQMAPPAT